MAVKHSFVYTCR